MLKCQDVMDLLKKYFPSIHFIIVSHLDTQKPFNPWSKGTPLLLVLEADFDITHVSLILQACRMQEVWGHGDFYLDFKRRPRRPISTGRGQNPLLECPEGVICEAVRVKQSYNGDARKLK